MIVARLTDSRWNNRVGKGSIDHPRIRWVDDLKRTGDIGWVSRQESGILKILMETYIQIRKPEGSFRRRFIFGWNVCKYIKNIDFEILDSLFEIVFSILQGPNFRVGLVKMSHTSNSYITIICMGAWFSEIPLNFPIMDGLFGQGV